MTINYFFGYLNGIFNLKVLVNKYLHML